jgi:hypothetical protein
VDRWEVLGGVEYYKFHLWQRGRGGRGSFQNSNHFSRYFFLLFFLFLSFPFLLHPSNQLAIVCLVVRFSSLRRVNFVFELVDKPVCVCVKKVCKLHVIIGIDFLYATSRDLLSLFANLKMGCTLSTKE